MFLFDRFLLKTQKCVVALLLIILCIYIFIDVCASFVIDLNIHENVLFCRSSASSSFCESTCRAVPDGAVANMIFVEGTPCWSRARGVPSCIFLHAPLTCSSAGLRHASGSGPSASGPPCCRPSPCCGRCHCDSAPPPNKLHPLRHWPQPHPDHPFQPHWV